MKSNPLQHLDNWNPQLLRELKGRLKLRNVLITAVISLLGQLLFMGQHYGRLPDSTGNYVHGLAHRYCTGTTAKYDGAVECLRDGVGNFIINWQVWWLDLFEQLSWTGIFVLLLVGVFMLISDLAQEANRGTLTFLQLSPQSAKNILAGKLLGVPILLYLALGLAVPLHLQAGVAAGIPLRLILSFYAVTMAGCVFFYSIALLQGLVGTWLKGFQPWLGTGLVLAGLWLATTLRWVEHNPLDWLRLLLPATFLPYLAHATGLSPELIRPYDPIIEGPLQLFFLPIGANYLALAGFMIFNYGLWSFWIWQGLNRCFHTPSATVLSRRQSYWLVAGFETLLLGFTLQFHSVNSFDEYLGIVLVANLAFFLLLTAALLPHRQVLQDWARYRHEQQLPRSTGKRRQRGLMRWNRALVWDLIWGEKSPALVAIALNLTLVALVFIPWSVLDADWSEIVPTILVLLLSLASILVLAAIAQLILLMKTSKRSLWASGVVSAGVILPPIVLGMLEMTVHLTPVPWLFSAFPWIALDYVAASSILLVFLGQLGLLSLLSWQLTRKLHQAGESASKALLAGVPAGQRSY
ncbi:MAG: ABC transporter permease [Cyanothece sp. SIO1E1]|nr:ABC transporter permease [Cyanothece sp. SIO1E1]